MAAALAHMRAGYPAFASRAQQSRHAVVERFATGRIVADMSALYRSLRDEASRSA